MARLEKPTSSPLRARLYDVIFKADNPAGKAFDVILLILILVSVLGVLLETVPSLHQAYGRHFYALEWVMTIIFTVEYGLRIYSVRNPWAYIRSFYGIVDLLAILPTYLGLLLVGARYFMVVRILRLLRVFRIFKLSRYVLESRVLVVALRASIPKITVFLFSVVTVVVIVGAAMYLIESPESGFTSIPQSIYWTIVTLTTVGYGDVAPQTPLGKFVASLVMILGYGIIAVPTGIVTVEMAQAFESKPTEVSCQTCGRGGHAEDARYCKYCSAQLSFHPQAGA